MSSRKLSRRGFFSAGGVAISLPYLETLQAKAGDAGAAPRRRMVAINIGLGLHGPNMIPEKAGRDYELTPYLQRIAAHREHFTVISGVSHPDVGGGHLSAKSFLTAAKQPNSAGFKNTISLDQFAAERLGAETRFRSLSLTSSGPGLSWSRSGVELPSESRPSRIFERLFLSAKPEVQAKQTQQLAEGRSILDTILDQSQHLQRRLGGRDRQKLDQYLESVRDAEQRLAKTQAWESRPKPQVDVPPPHDESDPAKMVEQMQLMYDMMHLALQTDSTRFITYFFTGMNRVPAVPGVDVDYHSLSHHGKDPAKIEQLTIIEIEVMKALDRFLTKLAQTEEADGSLLDSTMVLFGSNLGNASSHSTKNMPMVLAGGAFRHGSHLAFDRENNYPLPNLYVSMLQRLDLETDAFASATGTMNGLEML